MPTIKLLQSGKKPMSDKRLRVVKKVYNTRRWRKLRATKFRDYPLCESCEKAGRGVPTQHIHHIVPFDVDAFDLEARAFDYENLISLCVECHNKIPRGTNIERR